MVLEIPLSRPLPSALGVGALLKPTVTRIDGDQARVSDPLEDLDTAEAIAAHGALLDAWRAQGGTPVVGHDLHPDFPSTHWARASGLVCHPVQHHHAHVAAVLAEHRGPDKSVALALDGFGLGPDGTAWGGELLAVDGVAMVRLGHLRRLPQAGGDAAARQPWRMAAGALHVLGRAGEIPERFAAFGPADSLARLLVAGAPGTSSAGRLFDAACGLLGVHPVASFDGEAPMALERLVRQPVAEPLWRIGEDLVLDLWPLLDRLADLDDPADGADLFHGTLIAALADWAGRGAARRGADTVVLCGGCFHNRILAEGLSAALAEAGRTVLRPRRLPPGDPAISLGQAMVAARAAEGGDPGKGERIDRLSDPASAWR